MDRRGPILFGDIHNHNALGYGLGSLERSIEIARTHLDFFAFTGHSSWHDMEPMEGGREQHWLKGFARLTEGWPKVQALIADANAASDFAAFLGFEWHSSHFGDQCVVFADDHRPLSFAAGIDELRRFCLAHDALMIPHHLAYPAGMRGVNWEVFDEACTPVVEIYSEHGNSEDDRGPFPFFNHSMGGRVTDNTARAALARGLRFGFVASSDNHAGFPGAYGEGLLGVHAAEPSRRAVMEAIRARRTYALTGDRIELDLAVDGAPMGASIRAGARAEVAWRVAGRDEIEVVEVIQDGITVHRAFAAEATALEAALAEPLQLRLEWGWGPWGDLALERVCDWRFELRLEGGRIARVFPCLQSGPFDEARRHRIERIGHDRVAVVSYTSRRGAYRQNPNQGLVLELEATREATLTVALEAPARQVTTTSLAELFAGSRHVFAGPFPKESWQWHRLVPRVASSLDGACTLSVPDRPGHVYLRAKQRNGQLAWASPVFLNHA